MGYLKGIRHKCGKAYWHIVKIINRILYKVKKWLKSLFVWISGIGHTYGSIYNAKNAETLIICAHPDDETIFFSSIIKEKSPFVICMSHSGNRVRRQEFSNALKAQKCQYGGLLLNFPDVKGMTWVWKYCLKHKLQAIKKFCPNVKTVYTHAGTGESGHPHHFFVHDAVVKVFYDIKIYHTAEIIETNSMKKLSNNCVQEKMSIISDIYSSQVNMLVKWCDWYELFLNYENFFEEIG